MNKGQKTDKKIVELLRSTLYTHSAIAEMTGAKIGRVGYIARKYNLRRRANFKMASVASVREIKQQLAAGRSPSSVAAESGLSRTTVWRISAGRLDLRQRQAVQDKCNALLREMRRNPFLSTSALANRLGVETKQLYGVRQILRKQLAGSEQKQTPQTSTIGIDMSYVDLAEGKFSAKKQGPKKPKVPNAVDVLLQKHGIA